MAVGCRATDVWLLASMGIMVVTIIRRKKGLRKLCGLSRKTSVIEPWTCIIFGRPRVKSIMVNPANDGEPGQPDDGVPT